MLFCVLLFSFSDETFMQELMLAPFTVPSPTCRLYIPILTYIVTHPPSHHLTSPPLLLTPHLPPLILSLPFSLESSHLPSCCTHNQFGARGFSIPRMDEFETVVSLSCSFQDYLWLRGYECVWETLHYYHEGVVKALNTPLKYNTWRETCCETAHCIVLYCIISRVSRVAHIYTLPPSLPLTLVTSLSSHQLTFTRSYPHTFTPPHLHILRCAL